METFSKKYSVKIGTLERGEIIKEEIIDGKTYRLVTLRGRSKLIAKDGSAINPFRRGQKATIHFNSDGYPCYGGGVPVHLYVAHAWVDGYFDGAEVNHINFDRTDYRAENLEWVTHVENIKYSVKENSDVWDESKRGVNNGRATFTEDEIRYIRERYDSGASIASILKEFRPGLEHSSDYKSLHSTFSNICHRKTWKHIK